jgi:hypothetical protein
MQKISGLPAKERRIRSCNLVAPLAGLDDAAAIVKLWQGLIEDDNNIFEWTFMWWLRAVGYLHPDIVEMAVSRWQAAQDLTDRNKEAQTAASQFEDYVNSYRLEIGGKDTTRIESPAAARNWLDSLKKQKNSLRNEQALDKR